MRLNGVSVLLGGHVVQTRGPTTRQTRGPHDPVGLRPDGEGAVRVEEVEEVGVDDERSARPGSDL